jgi:hypothetical protein
MGALKGSGLWQKGLVLKGIKLGLKLANGSGFQPNNGLSSYPSAKQLRLLLTELTEDFSEKNDD